MIKHFLLLLFLLQMLGSCVSYNELLYFRNDGKVARQIDSTVIDITNIKPLIIQKNDILTITVRSFEQELVEPFNIASAGSSLGQGASAFNTYEVDEEGLIDFPVLGKIKLEGKTINEAKVVVENLLKEYLQAPSLSMRLINFRVSVLGEVNNPGTFSITSDRVSLLEALGMAKDITPYGNVKNILIIREQNGQRTFETINLQSTSFIRSDYYYLRQGDVIYIEPRRDKQAIIRDSVAEYSSLIVTGIQTLIGVATFIIITSR
ncbi:MAG: polysaccharide biosynthesis/export family protein [Bacteroidota bacterium]